MSENTIRLISAEYAGAKIEAYNPTSEITLGGDAEDVVNLMREHAHCFDDDWVITVR